MQKKVSLLLVICLCLLGLPRLGLANGRPINTTGLFLNPFDPNVMLIRATLGLILSTDAGDTWQWICEQSVAGDNGFGGADPPIVWTGANSLVLSAIGKTLVSYNQGCTWQAPAITANVTTAAFATSPTDANHWYVGYNTINANDANHVYTTFDNGNTFAGLGLNNNTFFLTDIKVASSNGNTLYAAGYGVNNYAGPLLARSSNAGFTWSAVQAVTGARVTGTVAVELVVSDQDANVVYIAVTDINEDTTIFLSQDGGQTAQTIFAVEQPFRNLALSADGSTVWVATQYDIYRSNIVNKDFVALSAPRLNACLQYINHTLYACGAVGDGFAFAKSVDDGNTFVPLFNLRQLSGPLQTCDNIKDVCISLWPNQQQAILALGDGSQASVAQSPNSNTTTAQSPNATIVKHHNAGGCSCSMVTYNDAYVWLVVSALVMVYRRLLRNIRKINA